MTKSADNILSATQDRAISSILTGLPSVKPIKAMSSLRKRGYKISKILREILKTTFGKGKLHPREYFYYGLFENDLSIEDKKRFIGSKLQFALHTRCNSLYWFALADNKEIFYAAMKGYGFKTPETVAVLRRMRTTGLGITLNTGDELRSFLSETAKYPLFAKPINGMFSIGAIKMSGINKKDQHIIINSTQETPIDKCIEYIFNSTNVGYLFQELLTPHESLVKAFGTTALSTIRFLVIVTSQGAEIISAVYRVPANNNFADNFWRNGNILCAVNLEDGKTTRSITGTGLEMKDCPKHPSTNAELVGMTLPNWSEAKELCIQAAGTLPEIHTQSWDIALTDSGPAIIEVNFGGDLNLHQLAHRKGLLQGSYLNHVRMHGAKINI
jgi:glutathione synthase/RimK-type ligase-like ATP-grasp enzyme